MKLLGGGGGEETDWVGKELASLFFPRGKNGPAHSFPGEKTDWGEIPACYTGPRSAVRRVLTAGLRVASSIPARSHTFMEIDHEIISKVIFLLSTESFTNCQLQSKVCSRSTG